jgi:hypothetical protein
MAAHLHASVWRDFGSVCSFADEERHLGHVVKADGYWLAYDATHINESETGFQLIGRFRQISAAKRAVELAAANGTGDTATPQ